MSLHVDIRKSYGDFTLEMAFDAGAEVVGLLGASGCGKSLTMRCIAGIETPDEGRIVVNDRVFYDSAAGINLKPQERKTALLFQNYMLFPNLTVEDNVAAGIPRKLPAEQRRAIIDRELKRFDVDFFAKRYPAQLSGGQQQRVALARMLAAQPGILMLDEPFSALDSHLKGMLEQNLANLFDAFEGTILYVSHDIDEALSFCDRIAVVDNGRIMEYSEARSIIDDPQSMAGLRLSGCKNATAAQKIGPRSAYCPRWGVTLESDEDLPDDLKAAGARAFHIERATEPGPNVFRVRVDRITESRFEIMALLRFLDRSEQAEPAASSDEAAMKYLHQHLFWRLSLLQEDASTLPRVGDELLIRIPAYRIHFVCK
ncbi:MAG: sulfate/molybdate ABC transporter ATP-binding protein [Coriobacteriales bacterium]|jgi:molybdate transport system ATP-binding protein